MNNNFIVSCSCKHSLLFCVFFFFFWFVLVEGIKMFFCLPKNSLIRISFKLCGLKLSFKLLNSIKSIKTVLNSYIMGKVCVCIYIYLKV